MLKRSLVITVFIVLSSLAAVSQEVNVYWGKENPVDRKGRTELLGRRGNLIFGYKESRKELSLLKYSADDLQIKGETPLIGNAGKGSIVIDNDNEFNQFLMMKNKTYFSVSKYDRKADKNSIYMQEITNEGKMTGKLTKLADISAKSRRNSGSFLMFTSKDSLKLLIVNNPPYEKYAGEKFIFNIFDENLKALHKLEVALPYKDKNFSAEDYILGNDGIIYLLARIDLEKKDKKKDEAGYYYEILTITPTGKGEVSEFELKLPNKYINDVSYTLDEAKGIIICSGFYGKIEKKGFSYDDINGIFYLRINKESKIVEASDTKELDKDFIAELTSQRKANKGRGISNCFTIKKFVTKSDGGAVLIAEYTYDYVQVVTTTDPKTGATTTRYIYHYIRNNILAININPDGSIKWYTNIPKYQHTTNDGGAYNSFMFATHNDKMYFIYNEDPRNLDPAKVKTVKDMRTMTRPYKSTSVLVELSESGEFTKKTLFSNKQNKITLMPDRDISVSDNEKIAYAFNPGMYCCFISFKAAKSKLARFEFK